ncbi:MAG TPA: DMT family transporter [Gaiellaceae bacterium]|nr:DMT family transporter [Gaiellaceae bacterium]
MTGILLALGASLSWGVADFGAGVGSRRLPVPLVILASQAAGLVFVGLVVAIVRPDVPSAAQLGDGALAGAVGALGLLAFYRGLAVGAMGIVGPISATGAVVPLTYGLLRGERPSALQLLGVALAVAGVIAAAIELRGATATGRVGAGVGLALLAAAGFGSSILFLSRAAAGGALWAPLSMRAVTVPLVLAGMLVLRQPLGGMRASWWLLAGVGVCDTGANLLFALATSRGLLSVVAVLASLYPVVLVVLARVLLHERIAPHQLGGVVVALTGVALISAG